MKSITRQATRHKDIFYDGIHPFKIGLAVCV